MASTGAPSEASEQFDCRVAASESAKDFRTCNCHDPAQRMTGRRYDLAKIITSVCLPSPYCWTTRWHPLYSVVSATLVPQLSRSSYLTAFAKHPERAPMPNTECRHSLFLRGSKGKWGASIIRLCKVSRTIEHRSSKATRCRKLRSASRQLQQAQCCSVPSNLTISKSEIYHCDSTLPFHLMLSNGACSVLSFGRSHLKAAPWHVPGLSRDHTSIRCPRL